jgi:hypothetical protein
MFPGGAKQVERRARRCKKLSELEIEPLMNGLR